MKAAIEELAAAENTTMSMLIEAAIERRLMAKVKTYRIAKIAERMHDRLCNFDDKNCTLAQRIYDWLYEGETALVYTYSDIKELIEQWEEYNQPEEKDEV